MPLKAPNMYIRKKRIAHARDFQKFLKVRGRNIGDDGIMLVG